MSKTLWYLVVEGLVALGMTLSLLKKKIKGKRNCNSSILHSIHQLQQTLNL